MMFERSDMCYVDILRECGVFDLRKRLSESAFYAHRDSKMYIIQQTSLAG